MDILIAAAVTGLVLTGIGHFGSIALVLHRRVRRGSRRGPRPRAAVSILRPV
jgi:hypothetical protein